MFRNGRLSQWQVIAILCQCTMLTCTDDPADPCPDCVDVIADESADDTADSNTDESADSNADESADSNSDESADSDAGEGVDPAHEIMFTEVELVGGELGFPTDMAFVPGTDELFMVEQTGAVQHLRLNSEDEVEVLGAFSIEVHMDLDCGLLGIALDPEFETNSQVYLSFCESRTHSEIWRYTIDTEDYGGIAESGVMILRAGHDDAPRPWHNVGAIGFDPGGYFWAFFGDKRVSNQGQDTDTVLASMIRIEIDEDGGHTGHPDNPFAEGGGNPDIYAYGLRSPWRGALDSQGNYWTGDVGENDFEEIDIITEAGQNFGWAIAEGPCEGDDCDGLVDPLLYWGHDDDDVPYFEFDPDADRTPERVAWVGEEYRPNDNDPYGGRLDNLVFWGDICIGFIRGARLNAEGQLIENRHIGHLTTTTGWRQAENGYIYAATYGGCSSTDEAYPEVMLVRAVSNPNFDGE